jgi:hypothetical protein
VSHSSAQNVAKGDWSARVAGGWQLTARLSWYFISREWPKAPSLLPFHVLNAKRATAAAIPRPPVRVSACRDVSRRRPFSTVLSAKAPQGAAVRLADCAPPRKTPKPRAYRSGSATGNLKP